MTTKTPRHILEWEHFKRYVLKEGETPETIDKMKLAFFSGFRRANDMRDSEQETFDAAVPTTPFDDQFPLVAAGMRGFARAILQATYDQTAKEVEKERSKTPPGVVTREALRLDLVTRSYPWIWRLQAQAPLRVATLEIQAPPGAALVGVKVAGEAQLLNPVSCSHYSEPFPIDLPAVKVGQEIDIELEGAAGAAEVILHADVIR